MIRKLIYLSFMLASCKAFYKNSDTKTVEVKQSETKAQTGSNCWIYAVAGWVEALHLAAAKDEVNISENYWMYWHYFNQIYRKEKVDALDESGYWEEAIQIIRDYGFAYDRDFLGDLSKERTIFENATAKLRAELTNGRLASRENRFNIDIVNQVFDEAFELTKYQIVHVRKSPLTLDVLGFDGSKITLKDLVDDPKYEWTYLPFPDKKFKDTLTPNQISKRQRSFDLVKNSLNANQSVIMHFHNDHNIFNSANNMYEYKTPPDENYLRTGGAHLVVLNDYVTEGGPGEGPSSPEEQQRALSLPLKYFLAKNSWGQYGNGPTYRYHRSFLEATTRKKNANDTIDEGTNLRGFVVPNGILKPEMKVTPLSAAVSEAVFSIEVKNFPGAYYDWVKVVRLNEDGDPAFSDFLKGYPDNKFEFRVNTTGLYEVQAGFFGMSNSQNVQMRQQIRVFPNP